MMTALLALIAAAYWSAEERAGRTDWLLRRLAASRTRVWAEKAAAGITIVLGIVLCQWLWFTYLIWDATQTEPIGQYLSAVAISSYLIGLPLSCLISQTIGVVLVGLAVELTGMWIRSFWLAHRVSQAHTVVWVALIVTVPIVAALFVGRAARAGRWAPQARAGQSGVRALILKQVRENLIIYIVPFVLAGLAIAIGLSQLTPPPALSTAVILAAALASIVLGISTYSQSEKEGLHCVLYHHPVPRSTIYWAKFLTGLIAALVLACPLAVVVHQLPAKLVRELSWFTQPVLAAVFIFVLIPYCCGVLVTHMFKRPLYAVLGAIAVLSVVVGVIQYLISYAPPILYLYPQGSRLSESIEPIFPWPAVFVLVGLALAGWRVATDRAVLTGTTFFRQVYSVRLLLFVLAMAVILSRTGWWDPFYLITNIDLGAG